MRVSSFDTIYQEMLQKGENDTQKGENDTMEWLYGAAESAAEDLDKMKSKMMLAIGYIVRAFIKGQGSLDDNSDTKSFLESACKKFEDIIEDENNRQLLNNNEFKELNKEVKAYRALAQYYLSQNDRTFETYTSIRTALQNCLTLKIFVGYLQCLELQHPYNKNREKDLDRNQSQEREDEISRYISELKRAMDEYEQKDQYFDIYKRFSNNREWHKYKIMFQCFLILVSKMIHWNIITLPLSFFWSFANIQLFFSRWGLPPAVHYFQEQWNHSSVVFLREKQSSPHHSPFEKGFNFFHILYFSIMNLVKKVILKIISDENVGMNFFKFFMGTFFLDFIGVQLEKVDSFYISFFLTFTFSLLALYKSWDESSISSQLLWKVGKSTGMDFLRFIETKLWPIFKNYYIRELHYRLVPMDTIKTNENLFKISIPNLSDKPDWYYLGDVLMKQNNQQTQYGLIVWVPEKIRNRILFSPTDFRKNWERNEGGKYYSCWRPYNLPAGFHALGSLMMVSNQPSLNNDDIKRTLDIKKLVVVHEDFLVPGKLADSEVVTIGDGEFRKLAHCDGRGIASGSFAHNGEDEKSYVLKRSNEERGDTHVIISYSTINIAKLGAAVITFVVAYGFSSQITMAALTALASFLILYPINDNFIKNIKKEVESVKDKLHGLFQRVDRNLQNAEDVGNVIGGPARAVQNCNIM